MSAIAVEVLPRARGRALALAAATLWAPVAVPWALGMLAGSASAASNYLVCVPIVPGVIVPVLFGLDGVPFVLVALVPVLAALVALYAAAREMPRGLFYAVQSVVLVLVAFEAIGFANALRA